MKIYLYDTSGLGWGRPAACQKESGSTGLALSFQFPRGHSQDLASCQAYLKLCGVSPSLECLGSDHFLQADCNELEGAAGLVRKC